MEHRPICFESISEAEWWISFEWMVTNLCKFKYTGSANNRPDSRLCRPHGKYPEDGGSRAARQMRGHGRKSVAVQHQNTGVPETTRSSSTTSASKLLWEVDKDVLIDRSHRSLAPRKRGEKPWVIVAKLHYIQDCVEVLSRAHTRAPLRYNGETVAIFTDDTSRAAKPEPRSLRSESYSTTMWMSSFGILFPARLRVTHNGEVKEFVHAE